MNNIICRLCLSLHRGPVHHLFENSELKMKITSLQLEILHDESLPNLICQQCNVKIDQIHTFIQTVIQNQNILYKYLSIGNGALNSFYKKKKSLEKEEESRDNILDYLTLKQDLKEEIGVIIKEELTNNNEDSNPPVVPIKYDDYGTSFEYNSEDTSEDNMTLKSLKESEENSSTKPLNIINNKRKSKTKEKSIKVEEKDVDSTHSTEIEDSINLKTTDKPAEILEYKCLTCFKVFDNRPGLLKHYQVKHKPEALPTCDLDNYSTVDVNGLKKFECGKCGKKFSKKKHVRSHIQYTHQNVRPYLCNLCGRTYKVVAEIIQHLRAHNGVKLYCSYNCGYSTAYSAGLRTHEKKHRDEHKYKCEKCGKGFEVRTWYEEHQNIHTGAKPFVCNVCGLAYPFKRYLIKHQTDSHPSKDLPIDTSRFICIHCQLPCGNKVALKRHLCKEHGIKRLSFLCDLCGKSFSKSSHLAYHKKSHLGIRNFTCSTCKKSFLTRSVLSRHELSHSGRKEHGCQHCGKKYARKVALLTHETSRPTNMCRDAGGGQFVCSSGALPSSRAPPTPHDCSV